MRDLEQREELEAQKKTITSFEERSSNKKIKVTNWDDRVSKNDNDIILLLKIYNDSDFPMKDFYARIEEVKYVKNNDKNQIETNLPKNILHLSWVGDPAMGDRTKPILAHDYAQIKIAETITKLNIFKLTTIESNEYNKFQKPGYYLVTINICGTFDGRLVTKRVTISISYHRKVLKVAAYFDLSEEVRQDVRRRN